MSWSKKIGVLIILVAALVVVYNAGERPQTEMETLESILKSAGATVTEGEVQFYAVLDNRYQKMDELESILLEVCERLGLQGGDVDRGEGDGFRVLDVIGETKFGPEAHVVVQSNPGDEEANVAPQTYLLIICRDQSLPEMTAIINRLEEMVTPYAPNGQLSFYLTGEIRDRKTREEMTQIAERALRSVRGNVVEGLDDEQMVSLTAYTPLLQRHMGDGSEKFNLNIAVRYDDYHDTTMLWAGFPLIHGSY